MHSEAVQILTIHSPAVLHSRTKFFSQEEEGQIHFGSGKHYSEWITWCWATFKCDRRRWYRWDQLDGTSISTPWTTQQFRCWLRFRNTHPHITWLIWPWTDVEIDSDLRHACELRTWKSAGSASRSHFCTDAQIARVYPAPSCRDFWYLACAAWPWRCAHFSCTTSSAWWCFIWRPS